MGIQSFARAVGIGRGSEEIVHLVQENVRSQSGLARVKTLSRR
jgi:hypothetical protein